MTADHFAVAADTLDRSQNFHDYSPKYLLGTEDNASLAQIVGRQLDGHFVAGEDAYVMHAHLAGDVTEHHVPVLKFDPKGRIGQVFDHLTLEFNNVFLTHTLISVRGTLCL